MGIHLRHITSCIAIRIGNNLIEWNCQLFSSLLLPTLSTIATMINTMIATTPRRSIMISTARSTLNSTKPQLPMMNDVELAPDQMAKTTTPVEVTKEITITTTTRVTTTTTTTTTAVTPVTLVLRMVDHLTEVMLLPTPTA